MALAGDRNNDYDKDENLRNVSEERNRRNYIYVGIAFTIFAVLTTAHLAAMLSGSFPLFDGLDRITDQLPFYENTQNRAEFEEYSGKDIILVCCSWGEELADGELTYFIGDRLIYED